MVPRRKPKTNGAASKRPYSRDPNGVSRNGRDPVAANGQATPPRRTMYSVARARAAETGLLPHELLLRWARSGRMSYAKDRTVKLTPQERITCLKGLVQFYRAPYAPRTAPGEQPPTVRLEFDEKTLDALASQPDQAQALRDVLRAIENAGGPLTAGIIGGVLGGNSDPARYGALLEGSGEEDQETEDDETEGADS